MGRPPRKLVGATLAWLALGVPAASAQDSPAPDPLRALERETIAWLTGAAPAVVAVSAVRPGASADGERARMWEVGAAGGGAGVCIAATGEVLTTTDVIGPAPVEAKVLWSDGRLLTATVAGRDPVSGAVLLRLPEGAYAALALGESAGVAVGDRVATLGNPFGSVSRSQQVAASAGHITATYTVEPRPASRFGRAQYAGPVFETDAAVNPGAFGGPLLDRQGRVIGLVAAAGTAQRWMGTAVPVDPMRARLPALRAGLGTPAIASARRVAVHGLALAPAVGEPGVVVMAAPAGGAELLAVGDVIQRVGEAPAPETDALVARLAGLGAGEVVSMGIARAGSPRTIVLRGPKREDF